MLSKRIGSGTNAWVAFVNDTATFCKFKTFFYDADTVYLKPVLQHSYNSHIYEHERKRNELVSIAVFDSITI